MIEVPQRTGMVRKNAADIKLSVDAVELSLERAFITVFVIASGDSDFTPLVLKLRELNKRVIGVGIEGSTSELLPGACDEFLFYGRLVGQTGDGARRRPRRREGEETEEVASDIAAVSRLVTQTLSGLQRSMDGAVLSSMIKRAILRKDPTFSESDYGFRAWGELMRHLEKRGVLSLERGSSRGDPIVEFSSDGGDEAQAFDLLREVVGELEQRGAPPPLSGLKNQLRKKQPGFSEKDFGYGGFLQFVKAGSAKGFVDMTWSDDAEDYLLSTRPG
jgi:NYN domain/OST-HTH/LOTUS domain